MAVKETNNMPAIVGGCSRRQNYEQLITVHYKDIFRHAYWLSKNRHVAEDLTQDAFLRAWRFFDQLQNLESAKTWLFTILRRENARRFDRFTPNMSDIEEYSSELPGCRLAEPDQQLEMRLLRKAIAELEPEYREPLVLQVTGGFSIDEISAMLNLTNNTVLSRLFRARNKLKTALDGHDSKRISGNHD
jgi:RNA polymerase sigma-70 factor, ECF subfamily